MMLDLYKVCIPNITFVISIDFVFFFSLSPLYSTSKGTVTYALTPESGPAVRDCLLCVFLEMLLL